MDRELMKDFLRESYPNPERKGCPDEDVLLALAEDRITPDDPAALHVGSCSECYEEYLHLRRELEESRSIELNNEANQDSHKELNVVPFPLRSDRDPSDDH